MRQNKGFTLIEMMITIAIVFILLTVVAPSVQTMLIQNRVTSDINSLSSAAQFARFTAINEQITVTLCPTKDYTECESSWSYAKMVFADSNGNGVRDTNEPLLTTAEAISGTNAISGLSGVIMFDENGSASKAGTATICGENNQAKYASGLIITLYGKVSVAVDSDGNGIKEDAAGNDLSCS